MQEFHQTGYGKRFFESQLPDLISNLGDIAKALTPKEVLSIVVHSILVLNNGIVELTNYKNVEEAFNELKRHASMDEFVDFNKNTPIEEFNKSYREWQDGQKRDILIYYINTTLV